jgi:erythromycin esterase-like protein
MYMGGDVTWNLRDTAFLDMIRETMAFVEQRNRERGIHKKARIIVWAHNSHVGDSAMTDAANRGQFNVGQLCRQEFGKDHVYIVGFTTHCGTVRAALKWGGKGMVMKLNPSHPDSHENVLHQVSKKRHQNEFGYALRSNPTPPFGSAPIDQAARQVLEAERYERFVGVQYARRTELRSHYSVCRLADQFDYLIHVDCSSALRIDRVDRSANSPAEKEESSVASKHRKWDLILTQDPSMVPRLSDR